MRSHPTSWVVLFFQNHDGDDSNVRAEAVRTARAEGHGVAVCIASAARASRTGEEDARALEQALGEAVVWHESGAAFGIGGGERADAAVHVIGGEGAADERNGSVAAALAARLGAMRLEVWDALPGLCTADPDLVPKLIELGVKELSMSAPSIPKAKKVVSET